jgi:hypothetical protein
MSWRLTLLSLLVVAGCSKASPTAPTATTPPTPTVTAPTVSATVNSGDVRVSGVDYVLPISWAAVPGASSYLVDVSDGIRATTTTEVTATTYDLKTTGRYCVGVRAKNSAGTSTNPSCITVTVLDMLDVIEALFFNAGPMAETEAGANNPATVMRGWPSGTTVPIVVGSNVPSAQHASISRVAEQFTRTVGVQSYPVVPSTRIETAFFEVGKIKVINPPAEQLATLCGSIGNRAIEGCSNLGDTTGGTISRALVTVWANTPWLAAHEVAHSFGVYHVRATGTSAAATGTVTLLMQTPRPVPEPNEFSPVEIEAIRTVYANGFRNGTPKQDFITRGLIRAR